MAKVFKKLERIFGPRTVSNGHLLKHTAMKELMKNKEKVEKLENDAEIHTTQYRKIPKNSEGKTGDKRIVTLGNRNFLYFKINKKWVRFELS
tara:strand:- start:118 stop:393 length:276 start_codon:yes stop_codon:yes gene_type:complete